MLVDPPVEVRTGLGEPGAEPQTMRLAGNLSLPRSIWILAGLALLIRIAAVLALANFGSSSALEHASIARGLLLGNGFAFNETADYTGTGVYEPTSVQSPPYPLLLATLYWLFGVDSPAAHLTAQLINALAAAATIPLLYVAVRQCGGTRHVALLSGALLAIWPTQIVAVASVQAITLITLASVAIVVLWYRSIDTGSLGPWIAFGVVGCLAALTEPVLLPPMALAGLIVLVKRQLSWPVRLRNAAVLLGCAVVIIGPWTYRNWRVHGALVPVKSTFWVNVWKGNNPNSGGTDRPPLSDEQLALFRAKGVDNVRQYDLLTTEQRAELDNKRAIEREAIWKRWATDFIRENPQRYAELCGLRLIKILWAEWDNPKSYDKLYIYFASRTILLIGSIVGLVLALGLRWRIGWPALIVGLSLLTYTLTITAARFAFPLEPFQIALTALTCMAAWQTATRSRQPSSVEGAAL